MLLCAVNNIHQQLSHPSFRFTARYLYICPSNRALNGRPRCVNPQTASSRFSANIARNSSLQCKNQEMHLLAKFIIMLKLQPITHIVGLVNSTARICLSDVDPSWQTNYVICIIRGRLWVAPHLFDIIENRRNCMSIKG